MNIKKGQFLAPADMANVVAKARSTGNEQIMVCERGVPASVTTTWFPTCAGWRSCDAQAAPVVFDATHSVQMPGGLRAQPPVGRERWCRYLRVPRSLRVWPASSWRPTLTRTRHCRMVRTVGPWIRWKALLSQLVELDQIVTKSRPFSRRSAGAKQGLPTVPKEVRDRFMSKIVEAHAREVLDSRGNPTVEAEVLTDCGSMGSAMRAIRCVHRLPGSAGIAGWR